MQSPLHQSFSQSELDLAYCNVHYRKSLRNCIFFLFWEFVHNLHYKELLHIKAVAILLFEDLKMELTEIAAKVVHGEVTERKTTEKILLDVEGSEFIKWLLFDISDIFIAFSAIRRRPGTSCQTKYFLCSQELLAHEVWKADSAAYRKYRAHLICGSPAWMILALGRLWTRHTSFHCSQMLNKIDLRDEGVWNVPGPHVAAISLWFSLEHT